MFLGEIFGPDLLIVVIVVAVLIFGGSAIPKLARNLGSAKNEFEKGLKTQKATDAAADKPADSTETKAPDAP
ncbi:MAG TPA: twin-arginine translocase TatA/TatE family subunit [Acidimicrobiales bacterium]